MYIHMYLLWHICKSFYMKRRKKKKENEERRGKRERKEGGGWEKGRKSIQNIGYFWVLELWVIITIFRFFILLKILLVSSLDYKNIYHMIPNLLQRTFKQTLTKLISSILGSFTQRSRSVIFNSIVQFFPSSGCFKFLGILLQNS